MNIEQILKIRFKISSIINNDGKDIREKRYLI